MAMAIARCIIIARIAVVKAFICGMTSEIPEIVTIHGRPDPKVTAARCLVPPHISRPQACPPRPPASHRNDHRNVCETE